MALNSDCASLEYRIYAFGPGGENESLIITLHATSAANAQAKFEVQYPGYAVTHVDPTSP
jgi:hypothetical protein